MNEYKVIVAHPERQHSFYLATALKRKGVLFKYITTVYDRPHSWTNKVKFFLRGKNKKKASGRYCNYLDDSEVVQFNEIFNLIIIFLARFPIFRDLCRLLRLRNGESFGIKVAKYAEKHNIDAVILFDTYAYSCFEYLKKKNSNIKCILDVTIMSKPYTRKVFDEIMNLTGDEKIREENFYLYDEQIMRNYKKEYEYGDYFLVGSQVVKESVLYCGVPENKVAVNPYGVDITKFNITEKSTSHTELKLIVVGQLNRRKGIHQLLHLVSQYRKEAVTLDLVGGFENTSDIYLNYKDCENITFHGFQTHDVLTKLYQEADVFVLPSFAEGLALVGLEAMASGLPIICSDCTGVNDLVVQYENGIVTRAGREEEIKAAINWFIEHKDKIPQMGRAAREKATEYTWDNYYERTSNFIISKLAENF